MNRALVEHEWLGPALDGSLEALSAVLLVLAFRALPFVAYAVLRGRRTPIRAAVLLAFYAALLIVASESARSVVLWSCVGFAYFAVVVCLLHWLSKATSDVRAADALLLFAFLLIPFLLVPATLLRPIALGTFQILGCELVLKGYSYVLENGARRCTLSSCLFFFLVDPSIVFVQRAKPQASNRLDPKAAGRVVAGLLSMFICFFLLAPLVEVSGTGIPEASGSRLLLLHLASGSLQVLAAYSIHSGLASIQLGLLRLCGHIAPERYNYPLLARSPLDFWSRWNTYIAQWAKRYLYMPFALALGRRFRVRGAASSGWTSALALLIAFIGVGAFHDLYVLSAQGRFALVTTVFFAGNAVFIILWIVVERAAAAWRTRRDARPSRSLAWTAWATSFAERFTFGLGLVLLITMSW
jgi:hypothetical protein